jgi:ribosome maturation protein Sdo1
MSPLRVNNSIIKSLKNNVDEILNNKLKRIMIRIISKIKKDIHNHLNESKEDKIKQLNEIKEN